MEVEAWLAGATGSPLAQGLVPGATQAERRRLAALGGLVRNLLEGVPARWPQPLKEWVASGTTPPAAVLQEARRLMSEPSDFFARLYEHVVAGPNRRRLGTFFTPPDVVELMIERAAAVMPSPETIVDPGAGVGAFSLSAARRWPTAKVQAVDINVVTLGLLAARLAVEGQATRVELLLEDFIRWVQRTDDARRDPRLFLGNPPYTRHQELDRATKARALKASGDLVDSGLSGLAAYFLAASIQQLSDADALCFVLPGSWTEGRHGKGLRRWLWEHTSRSVELLAFPADVEIFPGTRVMAVVLTIGPKSQATPPFLAGRVSRGPSNLVAGNLAPVPRHGDRPTSFGPLLWATDAGSAKDMVPMSSVGRVRRGVATGANDFFFLTDDEAAAIPNRYLRPGVRRLREVESNALDDAAHTRLGEAGRRRWLLTLTGPEDATHTKVRALLKAGEEQGYHERYLTRIRQWWYAVEPAEAPHIIVSLMSKESFRAVLNLVGAIPSNSMYGIHLDDPNMAGTLCSWLNSRPGQEAIRSRARHYSDGLLKLEPSDYMSVPVPATSLGASRWRAPRLTPR